MIVIMDTSSILKILEVRLDVCEVCAELGRCVVPRAVLRELEVLRRRKPLAAVALNVLDRCVEVVEVEGDADSVVVELAVSMGAAVMSGDRRVRARARVLGLPIVSISDKGVSIS